MFGRWQCGGIWKIEVLRMLRIETVAPMALNIRQYIKSGEASVVIALYICGSSPRLFYYITHSGPSMKNSAPVRAKMNHHRPLSQMVPKITRYPQQLSKSLIVSIRT